MARRSQDKDWGIIRRKDTYHLCMQVNGVLHRKSLKTGDIAVARLLRDEAHKQLLLDDAGIIETSITMRELIEEHDRVVTAFRKDMTIRNYSYFQDFIIQEVGKVKINRFGQEDYLSLIGKFGKDRSNTTVNKMTSRLMCLYKYAIKARHISAVPFTPDIKNETKRVREVLSMEEAIKFIDFVDANFKGKHIRAILTFTLFTGMSENEVLTATWDRLNIEQGTYISLRGKTEKERIIPVAPIALELLKALPKTNALIFPNRDGNPHPRTYLTLIIAKQAKKFGIVGKFSAHRFRASFACILKENGTDVDTIRELLGHSKLATTQRYFESSTKAKFNAIQDLQRLSEASRNRVESPEDLAQN